MQQKEAIKRLAKIVQKMEAKARSLLQSDLEKRLSEEAHLSLVGVEQHLDHLLGVIRDLVPPWIIAIEGIGGVGKTTLADALMRKAISDSLFDEIAWVTARQVNLHLDGSMEAVQKPALTAQSLVEDLLRQLLPDVLQGSDRSAERLLAILESRLKEKPHLIVIDNLETVVDVQDLLPTLRQLAEPSKFVLTSRERLYTEPNIYHYELEELNEFHTLQLVRQEARQGQLLALADSPQEVLRPIHETVGGNPLAIRLVIGQAHAHPLDVLLTELREAKSEISDNVYTYIYRRAWENLDELSRQTLIAMPLVLPSGNNLEFLASISPLTVEELRTGLNKLITFNLVNVHRDLYERRYSIHNLTRSFLHRQVLLWDCS
ncbi:AAA family ATPase [Chloroflexi bacterium TSY]|nr:AAA family ATPase [Chloroflexi bacterium TSY]